ncbi:MAG: hypothetical protein ABSF23_11605 [Terracidiphilus sp.]|jgi:hypothetical protein
MCQESKHVTIHGVHPAVRGETKLFPHRSAGWRQRKQHGTPNLEDAVAALSVRLTAEERPALEEPYVPHPVLGHS